MGITEKIGDKLRRKKSKVFEPQPEYLYPPMPKPPYPSSLRPTSVVQPPLPVNGRPIEAPGDQGKPWSADGFTFMIQEQKREEEELRRQNERKRIEEETVRRTKEINQNMELQRRKAEVEEWRVKRMQNASATTVRHLRGLMREKYRLDIYVWNQRNVQKADRRWIMEDCKKADTILQEIYFIVNAWEQDCFDNPEDWKVAKKIKDGLSNHKDQAIWADLPPWERRVNGKH